jgi:glycerophosphoryl diester phosphodiesterase
MFSLVTPAGVERVRASGRRVSTWTVDHEDDMARMVAAGVDAVVSNRIGALVRFLGRPSGLGD